MLQGVVILEWHTVRNPISSIGVKYTGYYRKRKPWKHWKHAAEEGDQELDLVPRVLIMAFKIVYDAGFGMTRCFPS